ncbi:MAG: hypothetical protein D6718_13930 [Acidobacteria bacterium]|nr:MAG: hypothetical protein D6718_13930 [Acidobacteriota bacterium]
MLALAFAAAAGAAEQSAPRLALALLDRGSVEFRSLDGKKLGEAKTGAGPRALAVSGDRLFVANRGVGDEPGSTVTVVDLGELEPRRTVKLCEGCAPRGLTFDSQGRLWMAGQAHRALYRVDPPFDDPAGSLLIAWGWPTDVVRMSGSDLLVVGYRDAGAVAVVDAARQFATRVEVFADPDLLVSPEGRREVWIASSRRPGLARLRPGAKPGEFTAETFDAAGVTGGLGATPDGSRLVRSVVEPPALVVVDTETGEERGRLTLAENPGRLAVSSRAPARAAVWLPASRSVAVVDLSDPAAPRLAGRFAVEAAVGAILFVP